LDWVFSKAHLKLSGFINALKFKREINKIDPKTKTNALRNNLFSFMFNSLRHFVEIVQKHRRTKTERMSANAVYLDDTAKLKKSVRKIQEFSFSLSLITLIK
jgi:hypothetical protein